MNIYNNTIAITAYERFFRNLIEKGGKNHMSFIQTIKRARMNRAYKKRVREAFFNSLFVKCNQKLDLEIQVVKFKYEENGEYPPYKIEVTSHYGKMFLEIDNYLLNLHSYIGLLNNKIKRLQEIIRYDDSRSLYLMNELYDSVFVIEELSKTLKDNIPFTNENIINAMKSLNVDFKRILRNYDTLYSEGLKNEIELYKQLQKKEKERADTLKMYRIDDNKSKNS